jgi:hypothetical protein
MDGQSWLSKCLEKKFDFRLFGSNKNQIVWDYD